MAWRCSQRSVNLPYQPDSAKTYAREMSQDLHSGPLMTEAGSRFVSIDGSRRWQPASKGSCITGLDFVVFVTWRNCCHCDEARCVKGVVFTWSFKLFLAAYFLLLKLVCNCY